MNDFQEQAKNWLRNVVKQDPDKIKAGVEKAGDLIDKQTGGKYADKVDSVQSKVGDYVDSQAAKGAPGTSETSPEPTDSTSAEPTAPPTSDGTTDSAAGDDTAGATDAGDATSAAGDETTGAADEACGLTTPAQLPMPLGTRPAQLAMLLGMGLLRQETRWRLMSRHRRMRLVG